MASAEDIFDSGLGEFGRVVALVPAEAWDAPSPCAGWTALDVFGHVTTTMGMGVSLLAGEQPTWPTFDRPADLVDGDPTELWASLSARARVALVGADLDAVMDTPMGPRSVRDRLAFPAIDLYVHAWDIGAAAGVTVEIPAEVIEFADSYIDPFPVDMVRGERGSFGPEVEAPEGATETEEFVAWTGRQPRTAQ